jgi:hypothetical protein
VIWMKASLQRAFPALLLERLQAFACCFNLFNLKGFLPI